MNHLLRPPDNTVAICEIGDNALILTESPAQPGDPPYRWKRCHLLYGGESWREVTSKGGEGEVPIDDVNDAIIAHFAPGHTPADPSDHFNVAMSLLGVHTRKYEGSR